MRHPEIRDVCDVGQMLFYGWRWVWYATAVMFVLNNTFIQVGHIMHFPRQRRRLIRTRDSTS